MDEDNVALDIRLNDWLQQISRLDDMIAFHRQQSGDTSAIAQYERMKTGFIQQMNQALSTYRLQVVPMAA